MIAASRESAHRSLDARDLLLEARVVDLDEQLELLLKSGLVSFSWLMRVLGRDELTRAFS